MFNREIQAVCQGASATPSSVVHRETQVVLLQSYLFEPIKCFSLACQVHIYNAFHFLWQCCNHSLIHFNFAVLKSVIPGVFQNFSVAQRLAQFLSDDKESRSACHASGT